MRKFIGVVCVAVSTLSAVSAFAADDDGGKGADKEKSGKEASASVSASGATTGTLGQRPISAGLLLGYGFQDAYAFGLGVRGGYTLPNRVYIGGTVVYHFGYTDKVQDAIKGSQHVWIFGAEGGYTFDFGKIIARPYLGLGLAALRGQSARVTPTGTGGVNELNFLVVEVSPGVTGLYPIGRAFVGLDMRFVINTQNSSFATYLTGGMTF